VAIGGSTDASTATRQINVAGNQPASFRYNNPGAQYPSAEAARFGQIGYGIIGGGHKIAAFPSPVNGAAANFDLLYRKYTGMEVGAAGAKWTGQHGFGVPGYDSSMMLTKEMVADAKQAIPIMKAFAGRESGKGTNLTEEQWKQAHDMFRAGSADSFLASKPPAETVIVTPPGAPRGATGEGMVQRARAFIGRPYVHDQVPKNDPNYKGGFDCAELMSYVLFQESGILYGCIDNNSPPAQADAWTGAWKRDVEQKGNRVSVEQASGTVGGIVLRYPPDSGGMGHIAICDGKGGTVEAKGARYGVVADTVQGRHWDTGILVPGILYDTGGQVEVRPQQIVYSTTAPNMNPEIVKNIQRVLGVEVDGEFGPDTEMAVWQFQEREGLTVDGEVGPETAAALGISLTDASVVGVPEEPPPSEMPVPWDPGQVQLPGFKMPPLGNPLNAFRYGMELMSIIKQFDPSAMTIEEYLRRAVMFFRGEETARIIEGRAVQMYDAPLVEVKPQTTEGKTMFGANWRTTVAGIATILSGLAAAAAALSKGSFSADNIGIILTAIMGIFGGSGLIAAKDKAVTGGVVPNDQRKASVEKPTTLRGD
jgi:cell wall-associated NlpC family hydrolase